MKPTDLAQELNIHPLAAEILARRGVGTPAAARGFLDPDYYRPQLPEALPGVRQAAELAAAALAGGRRILVWGDFDVDGQTATALLAQAFGDLAAGSDAPIRCHIPVRAVEGHGIHLGTLRNYFETEGGAAADAPELIVTCDTGVTAFDALDYARSRGAQVVVTDHHELAQDEDGHDRLPPADAVVTPRLLPPGHPLAGLPGVGVAYKLVEALYAAAGRAEEAEAYLDLAALGIVADVAEQTADTRYLLQLGLRRLRRTTRPGLLAIYERAGLKAETINEEHIGFVLGPRLNALGRLGDANPAVELLTTPDMGRARLLALQLEGLNARRQLLTSQTLQAALKQIEQDSALLDCEALVLSNPAWEPGIIGIVAGRLAERFGRPAALIAAPTGLPGHGSARSAPGVHITNALAANAALLRSYGGHAGAAGFTVDAENIPALRKGLHRAVAAQRAQTPAAGSGPAGATETPGSAEIFAAPFQPGEAAYADVRVAWEEIGPELAKEIERLAPFGQGNPPPALACLGVSVSGLAVVGRASEHLALQLTGPNGETRRAMWWGGADFAAQFPLPEEPLEAVVTLRLTSGPQPLQIEWLGYRRPAPARPSGPALMVSDFRREAHPLPALLKWLEQAAPDLSPRTPKEGDFSTGDGAEVFIWAEGDARRALAERLPGVMIGGRDEIPACRALAVWTSPPGASELADGLRRAGARQAALFAVDAGTDAPQAFLERLAGAARAALRTGRQDGVTLARLAAATAQRETAVRLGLGWLEAQGYVRLHWAEGQVYLSAGDSGEQDAARSAEMSARLRELLAETRAFRKFYNQAGLDALQIDRRAAGGGR